MNKYRETGHMEVRKQGGGKRKLTDQHSEVLRDAAINNPFYTNRQLKSTLNIPEISDVTVSRYLKKHGICSRIAAKKTKLTARDMAIRAEIAARNFARIADIQQTIFIDEFHIETNAKAQRRVKRQSGQRFSAEKIQTYNMRNRKTCTLVCCFSAKGLGPIKAVFGRMNSEKYLEYLQGYVLPYATQNFGTEFFILHDNSPIHTSQIVSNFLIEQLPGRVFEHPPYSPDLNPIENLGARLKSLVRNYLYSWDVGSDFELENVTRIAWRELSDNESLVDSLIQSMQSRYQSVLAVSGNHTKY